MMITVILCTANRCSGLAATLESVASSVVPESTPWEILVVDNNSRDATRSVVESMKEKFPGRFLYLFEPRAGKAYALNAGIEVARGDVLAFVDDDVTVEPAWLANLTAPLQDKMWAGSGGRVVLQWKCAAPKWLPAGGRHPLGLLAEFDLGLEPRELDEPPYGVNMAFRRIVFEKYGGFRTDLGPSPDRDIPRPGEDTEFGMRLLNAGERLRYVPSAVVYHPVPAERIRKQYFLTWWFDKGRSEIRQLPVPPAPTARGFMGLLHLFRNLAAWVFRWMSAIQTARRFGRKLTVWYKAGEISEYCFLMKAHARRRQMRAAGVVQSAAAVRDRCKP